MKLPPSWVIGLALRGVVVDAGAQPFEAESRILATGRLVRAAEPEEVDRTGGGKELVLAVQGARGVVVWTRVEYLLNAAAPRCRDRARPRNRE